MIATAFVVSGLRPPPGAANIAANIADWSTIFPAVLDERQPPGGHSLPWA